MTKRKRTPSPSPPPRTRVPFEIPVSLQRLSMISRSLAHQSDKLAGVKQDDQTARTFVQVQVLGGVPPATAATATETAVRDGQGQGFRAFAPRKQPSFPDAQTWVEPRPRATQIPDTAGFMPPMQPSFPQGQTWPQPQTRKAIAWPHLPPRKTPAPAPGPPSAPPPSRPEPALASLEAPPKDGETLCLETQPHRIAALIAQKRAANEANHKREAWTRQATAHRMSSQAPDDQLRSELNNALVQSSADNHARGAGTGEAQALGHLEQCVTPTTAITFDPVVPSAATQAESRPTALTKKGSAGSKEHTRTQKSLRPVNSRKEASSYDYDSLFSSSGSPSPSPAEPPKPGGGQNRQSAQHPNQHNSFIAQPSAPASTTSSAHPKATQTPSNNAEPRSNRRHADTSFVRQSQQSSHATPVAAGYYRFNPRHWQTSNTSQQQQQSQAYISAAQSGLQSIEVNAWPASHGMPQKVPPNPVFRNLTQDKFGRFGAGGKLRKTVGQQSGGGTS